METGNINKSLMTLCHCIEELRKNQESGRQQLVHYRRSCLTKLFKNYFDGDGKVLMIVCISPSQRDAEETYNVLKFSALTQEVSTKQSDEGSKPTGQSIVPSSSLHGLTDCNRYLRADSGSRNAVWSLQS